MKKFILLTAVLAVVLAGCTIGGKQEVVLKPAEAAQKAEKFINDNFMKPGDKAVISNPVLEDGLYKFDVKLPTGKTVQSYISLNGEKIFPQAVSLASTTDQQVNATADQTQSPSATDQKAVSVPKTDKPVVEAFVMSYCPYGTQIEKGLLPVVEALGNKINFAVKFVNYSMHGEKEVKENLNQYCIQTEQSSKFDNYLKCFLNSSDASSCYKTAGVDETKLTACATKIDTKYDITKNLNDKTTWVGSYPPFNIDKAENEKYNVQGSPTLIINGQEAQAGRDSASLLKAICGAFKTAPAECSKQLSSATPAPGFGNGTDTSGSAAAGCGTPAQ